MRALQLVLVATALIFGTVGTASFVCTGEGTTTYGGQTVDCVSVDGMLYDVWPVSAGVSTCAANQANSCPEGTDIWVPRSYNHAKAVWDAYSSYISFVGIYRPEDGCGSCTSYAMNSEAMEAYDGTAWTSVADTPEPWFVRSTVFSEPNGDYTANCFLHTFGWEDDVGWQFNDNPAGRARPHTSAAPTARLCRLRPDGLAGPDVNRGARMLRPLCSRGILDHPCLRPRSSKRARATSSTATQCAAVGGETAARSRAPHQVHPLVPR